MAAQHRNQTYLPSEIPPLPRDPQQQQEWGIEHRDKFSSHLGDLRVRVPILQWCLSNPDRYRSQSEGTWGQDLRLFLNVTFCVDIMAPHKWLGKSGIWVKAHIQRRTEDLAKFGTIVDDDEYLELMDMWTNDVLKLFTLTRSADRARLGKAIREKKEQEEVFALNCVRRQKDKIKVGQLRGQLNEGPVNQTTRIPLNGDNIRETARAAFRPEQAKCPQQVAIESERLSATQAPSKQPSNPLLNVHSRPQKRKPSFASTELSESAKKARTSTADETTKPFELLSPQMVTAISTVSDNLISSLNRSRDSKAQGTVTLGRVSQSDEGLDKKLRQLDESLDRGLRRLEERQAEFSALVEEVLRRVEAR